MLEMAMPWWEFMARAAIVYGALMLMVRVSGKRTVGQFTPFDLLVVMLLSESVSNSLAGDDHSVLGGLVVAGTLVGLNMVVATVSSHSRKAESLVEGSPVLVGRDGAWFEEVLKRNRVGDADVERALREADCELSNLKCAFLEIDGSISILKKDG